MNMAVVQVRYIKEAWLVILLALVFGGGLAVVQSALSDKIAENKKNETYDVIPRLVNGADKTKTVETIVTGKDGKDVRVYEARSSAGRRAGWVVPATGQGFADRIELLIGLDENLSTITGLYVLAQKETPGLGDNITRKDFRSRFEGKPTDRPLEVVTSDPTAKNEVLALTGATISSESVSGIVNTALANLIEPIRREAGLSVSAPKQESPAGRTQ